MSCCGVRSVTPWVFCGNSTHVTASRPYAQNDRLAGSPAFARRDEQAKALLETESKAKAGK